VRRLLAIIRRDAESSLRDFILLYGLLAPFLLALVMRAFLPLVGASTATVVVTSDLDPRLREGLAAYARVEVVASRNALDERVLAADDAVGVVQKDGNLRVVLEGNEPAEVADLPGIILGDILGRPGLELGARDLGRDASPVRPLMAILLAMTAMFIGGMFIGFNIIEDKETRAISALAVTPLSRAEYILGRGLMGLVLSMVLVLGGLYTFGVGGVDPWQLLAVAAVGGVLGVAFGFYIGSLAANQVAGIAATKVGGLFFILGPLLSALLPTGWHPVVWWLPTYWVYLALRDILTFGGIPWPTLGRELALSLLTSLGLVGLVWRPLRQKLSLRG